MWEINRSTIRRGGIQVNSPEVEKLHDFLKHKTLNRAFDYRVLCRAADLSYGDSKLEVKLNHILDQLRSEGRICWYVCTGKTYWIKR